MFEDLLSWHRNCCHNRFLLLLSVAVELSRSWLSVAVELWLLRSCWLVAVEWWLLMAVEWWLLAAVVWLSRLLLLVAVA